MSRFNLPAANETLQPLESIVAQSLVPLIGLASSRAPAERARALVFAWIVQLPQGANLQQAVSELALHLQAASKPNNDLLPHILQLLDIIAKNSYPQEMQRHIN